MTTRLPRSTLGPLALLMVAVAICSMGAASRANAQDVAHGDGMDNLVSAEWLAAHIDDPDVVVLDCTVVTEADEDGNLHSVSGESHYRDGHIPGAGFADLTGDLADADSELNFAVPEPDDFAAAMAALGVSDNSRVVLYDGVNSAWAARVWWMLRWIGFDNAALLDGGLDAWTAAGHSLSTDPADRPAGELSVNLRPSLIADRDEVEEAIGDESVGLIDALPAAHYRGEMVMYERPGHITSAENVPIFSVFDESGRFKSKVELEEIFSGKQRERNIHYCGGGIAASATAFAMTLAGHDDVAVYTASLQEWTADPDNPMETGDGTGDE